MPRILTCHTCEAHYDVSGRDPEARVRCKRCRSVLAVADAVERAASVRRSARRSARKDTAGKTRRDSVREARNSARRRSTARKDGEEPSQSAEEQAKADAKAGLEDSGDEIDFELNDALDAALSKPAQSFAFRPVIDDAFTALRASWGRLMALHGVLCFVFVVAAVGLLVGVGLSIDQVRAPDAAVLRRTMSLLALLQLFFVAVLEGGVMLVSLRAVDDPVASSLDSWQSALGELLAVTKVAAMRSWRLALLDALKWGAFALTVLSLRLLIPMPTILAVALFFPWLLFFLSVNVLVTGWIELAKVLATVEPSGLRVAFRRSIELVRPHATKILLTLLAYQAVMLTALTIIVFLVTLLLGPLVGQALFWIGNNSLFALFSVALYRNLAPLKEKALEP